MGSPLGHTLANTFHCHYEEFGLMNVLLQFIRVVYRRYIDDVFLLFISNKHLKLFVNYMNLKHKNIKFTFETEDSNIFFVFRCQNYPQKQMVCYFNFSQNHI